MKKFTNLSSKERCLSKDKVEDWLTVCNPYMYPPIEMVDHILDSYTKKDYVDLFELLLGDMAVFPFFVMIHDEMDNESYFKVLGRVLKCETYSADERGLVSFFLNNPKRDSSLKHYMMEDEEVQKLKGLPEEITIFRGTTFNTIDGYSWTLDIKHAEFFAKRHNANANPIIVQGTCLKSDVIAFFTREDEIFISPENVLNYKTIRKVKDVDNNRDRSKLSIYLNVLEKLRGSEEYYELKCLAEITASKLHSQSPCSYPLL